MAFSEQEEQIVKKLRKAKRFVFFCQHRHELRDEAFQPDLAGLSRKRTAQESLRSAPPRRYPQSPCRGSLPVAFS